MAITKVTGTVFVASDGSQWPTLIAAQYRDMANLFVTIFAAAGIGTNNPQVQQASASLGKRFVDATGAELTSVNNSISTIRAANP